MRREEQLPAPRRAARSLPVEWEELARAAVRLATGCPVLLKTPNSTTVPSLVVPALSGPSPQQ